MDAINFNQNYNGILKRKLNDSCDETSGWWYSIESADFNNDGLEDLVLGNLGKIINIKQIRKNLLKCFMMILMIMVVRTSF